MRHVTTPKVGFRVRIRESALKSVNAFYKEAFDKDDVLTIVQLIGKEAAGRQIIQCAHPSAPDRVLQLWRGQVNPLPRCPNCDTEDHKIAGCPQNKDKAA